MPTAMKKTMKTWSLLGSHEMGRKALGRTQRKNNSLITALPSGESEGNDYTTSSESYGSQDGEKTEKPSAAALAVPAGFRTAGAVFVLAGFLKILIVCFPYSTMAISMYLHGRAELGIIGAMKMIPIALAILAGAKVIVDKRLHLRRWFTLTIVFCSLIAMFLSRLIFSQPKASPLDPLLSAYRYQQTAVESMNAQSQRQRRESRSLQPSEEAKKILEEESNKSPRFDISKKILKK